MFRRVNINGSYQLYKAGDKEGQILKIELTGLRIRYGPHAVTHLVLRQENNVGGAMVQPDNVPTRIAPIVSFPDLYWGIGPSVVFAFVLELRIQSRSFN